MTQPLPVSATMRDSQQGTAPLRGFVDRVSARLVEGWAQNPLDPEAPVMLDICVAGTVVAQIFADRHRGDLERAGIGSGSHGFRVDLPFALTAGQIPATQVRRTSDGTLLERSPACARFLARAGRGPGDGA